MSASAERIYLQIIELETKIQENKSTGRSTDLIEEQVFYLREELSNLTEALTRPNFVLKG